MTTIAPEFTPVIWVTLIYVLVYYGFMILGLQVKLKIMKQCKSEGKVFDRYSQRYPELLAADRVQLNTLEHMPPFLILMWMQAFTDSPHRAAILGGIYVLLRILYPFFMGSKLKGYVPKRLFLNTFAAYGVLVTMAGFVISGII